MTHEQILEILDSYKLRIPPTVFYDLKADIVNYEEQEPTTKNDLGVEHHKQNIKAYAHDFGVSEEQAEKELRVTIKNDLGVDCISRADLYNRIKKIDHDEDYECDEFGGSRITYHTCDWDEVLREIEYAPSVTPQEPRKGHWVDEGIYADGQSYHSFMCSECEWHHIEHKNEIVDFNYCPYCGADMREVEE